MNNTAKKRTSRIFRIYKKPFAFHGNFIEEDNEKFISTFSENHFYHIGKNLHRSIIDSQNTEEINSLKIAHRQNYLNALETFFGFICASIQAPSCTFGWLLKYKTEELKNMVLDIQKEKPVKTIFDSDPVGWEKIYEAISPRINQPIEMKNKMKFGIDILQLLSREFTNNKISKEYNSLKHGLRGFSNSISEIHINDQKIQGENNGTEFIEMLKFENSTANICENNSLYQSCFIHWDIEIQTAKLKVMSFLLANIKEWLKHQVFKTRPSKIHISLPTDEEYNLAMRKQSKNLIDLVFFKGHKPNDDEYSYDKKGQEQILKNMNT